MTLLVHRCDGAAAFRQAAEPWLLEAEAENNLILGLALRNAADPSLAVPGEYWATVTDDGAIVGCAFRTPPLRAVISRMRASAAALVCDDMLECYGELPGVTGELESAQAFADRWAASRGGDWITHIALRIHALDRVIWPAEPAQGELRHATEADAALVHDWLVRFAEETTTEPPSAQLVRELIAGRRARIWEDGEPRCMVAAARETPGVGTINAVYTPSDYRGRGYATAAVAALSQELLDGGKRMCALYTDLANPTSNSIYAAVGYRPVRDDIDLTFRPASG